MSSCKRYTRVLGLALAAVFAFSAFAASAHAASPEWVIDGNLLSGSEEIGSAGGPFALAVPARGITIQCETEENTGSITAPRQDAALVEFSGCSVVGAPTCQVAEPIKADTKTELLLVGGGVYDRFEPVAGTTFTEITISGCAAAGTFPVTGKACGEGEELGVELVEQPLRFSEATATACGTELKFGGTKATLTGESLQFLTGADAGKKWGAI